MSMPSTQGRRYNTAAAFAAAGDHNSERGNFVLRPGAADVWKPSYQQNSVMTLRVLPVPNPENPSVLDAFRYGTGPGEFGDWMRYYPACRGFGEGQNKVTFIIGDPLMDPSELQRSPAHVLFNAVSQRVKAKTDPGWGGYLDGEAGRTADLPKPDGLYLFQAAVLQNGMKMYQPWKGTGNNDKAPVIMLSPGLGKGIRDSLEKFKAGYTGDPRDFENSLEVGDPISLQHGRFLTIFRKADGNPRTRGNYQQQGPVSTFGGSAGPEQQRGGGRDNIGYDFIWEPNFMGAVSPSLPGLDAAVLQCVQPWDNMINIMSFDEQARVLAQPGRFPANMLVYAWNDHPDWIDEDLRRRSVNAVSAQVPGIPGMPYGMPGQMPYGMPGQQFGGMPGQFAGYPQQPFPQQPFPQQQAPQQFGAGFGGPQPAPQEQYPQQSGGFGGQPAYQPPPFDVPPQTQTPAPVGGFGGFGGAPPVTQFPTQTVPFNAPPQQPAPQQIAGYQQQPFPQQAPPVQQPPVQQQFGGFGGGPVVPQVGAQQFHNPMAGTPDASVPTGAIPPGVPGGIPVQQFPGAQVPQHVQQAPPQPVQHAPQIPVQQFAPPVQQPPVQMPPAQQPPVQQMPVQQFPQQAPPVQQPPVQQQPVPGAVHAPSALDAARRALGRG